MERLHGQHGLARTYTDLHYTDFYTDDYTRGQHARGAVLVDEAGRGEPSAVRKGRGGKKSDATLNHDA